MLTKFTDYLIIKKGFGEITIKNYQGVIKRFIKELKDEKPKQEKAEEYIANIIKKGYSYSHIVNTSVAIERYMDFLGKSVSIKRPRKPKVLVTKEVLTEGEIARMMAVIINNREEAIFSILVYSGMRNKELCKLKVKDIDNENCLIKIFGGKFSKDRIVPITKECIKSIQNYFNKYPREHTSYLFTTLVKNTQYNGGALRKLVKVIAKRAKIKKRVYPHLFRHSLATHLLSKGMNIVAVQKILGHERIETTLLYIHLSPKKIQSEYSYFIPSYQ